MIGWWYWAISRHSKGYIDNSYLKRSQPYGRKAKSWMLGENRIQYNADDNVAVTSLMEDDGTSVRRIITSYGSRQWNF
jgi:hypothetical protein